MQFVGIDLAERHTAAVVINEEAGAVVSEHVLDTGPKQVPPNPFEKAHLLAEWWVPLEKGLDQPIIAIEDIPPHMMDPKPVLKLQGALIGFLILDGYIAHLPRAKDWQDAFGYSKKEHGDSKKWAQQVCEDRFGYVPGSLVEPGVKVLAKQRTDLRDAFLIAQWLRELCLS